MNTHDFDTYFMNMPSLRETWRGAHAANTVFNFSFSEQQCLILNADESRQSGSHWLAIYVPAKGHVEFFDSLENTPEYYHIYFKTWLESSGRGYVINKYRYQDHGTNTCGVFCLYFLSLRIRGCSMSEILGTLDASNYRKNELLMKRFIL